MKGEKKVVKLTLVPLLEACDLIAISDSTCEVARGYLRLQQTVLMIYTDTHPHTHTYLLVQQRSKQQNKESLERRYTKLHQNDY